MDENRETIRLEIPTAKRRDGYASDRVSVGALTDRQAAALKFLRDSLADNNERCGKRNANHGAGVVVDTNADAIRWVLDRVAVELG
ncbi:MAG: hypothetical protein AAF497_00890 [Planctomycetota bacterium]